MIEKWPYGLQVKLLPLPSACNMKFNHSKVEPSHYKCLKETSSKHDWLDIQPHYSLNANCGCGQTIGSFGKVVSPFRPTTRKRGVDCTTTL